YLEAFAVPRGIGNDVDSHRYVERASELQCLEILGKRHTFAITPESLIIDCFKAEEHGLHAKSLPELEDLLVAQQHVAPRFEVVSFSDPAAGDGLAKPHAMLGLNESYVVYDKNSGLAYLR